MPRAVFGLLLIAVAGGCAGNEPPRPEVTAAPCAFPPSDLCGHGGLVFFDWDSVAVTPRGRQIGLDVARLAARSVCGGEGTRIALAAHADRSGPPHHNLGLSRRRGEAIASILAEAGFPAERVTLTAFGEDRPMVQTPDGIREPQNRRVQLLVLYTEPLIDGRPPER